MPFRLLILLDFFWRLAGGPSWWAFRSSSPSTSSPPPWGVLPSEKGYVSCFIPCVDDSIFEVDISLSSFHLFFIPLPERGHCWQVAPRERKKCHLSLFFPRAAVTVSNGFHPLRLTSALYSICLHRVMKRDPQNSVRHRLLFLHSTLHSNKVWSAAGSQIASCHSLASPSPLIKVWPQCS